MLYEGLDRFGASYWLFLLDCSTKFAQLGHYEQGSFFIYQHTLVVSLIWGLEAMFVWISASSKSRMDVKNGLQTYPVYRINEYINTNHPTEERQ